jgi:hypothetical protein
MKAIERLMEDKARNSSVNWTNVLMGQSRITVDPYEYGVKFETLQKQANKEGFKTQKWGDELQIYR